MSIASGGSINKFIYIKIKKSSKRIFDYKPMIDSWCFNAIIELFRSGQFLLVEEAGDLRENLRPSIEKLTLLVN